jgi:hypothetical protein
VKNAETNVEAAVKLVHARKYSKEWTMQCELTPYLSDRQTKRERFGAAHVLKDQEHNGEAKGEGIGMSPTAEVIYFNCHAHPQGFEHN